MQYFTSANLDEIRSKMNTALSNIEKEYGIKFNIGRMRYTNTSFTCKIESLIDNPGEEFKPGETKLEYGRPIVGKIYEIGDPRNGHYKVKIIKNKRTKASTEIVEVISTGSRPKTQQFSVGTTIIVPFTAFNSKL